MFKQLQDALSTAVQLATFNPAWPVDVWTDASNAAGGFATLQRNAAINVQKPIAFHSFKFSVVEQNYAIHDQELLPVVACRNYGWM